MFNIMTEGRKSVVAVIAEATSGSHESWVINSASKSYSVKVGDGGEKNKNSCVFLLLLFKNFILFLFCRERRGVGKISRQGGERGEYEGAEKRSRALEEVGAGVSRQPRRSTAASPAPAGLSSPCASLPPVSGAGGVGIGLSMRERTGARAAAPRCNAEQSSPELLGQASFLLLRGKTRQQSRSYALSRFKVVGKL